MDKKTFTPEMLKHSFTFAGDVWNFFKKYMSSKENSDEYWDRLVEEASSLCEKYTDEDEKTIIQAVMNYIDRFKKA